MRRCCRTSAPGSPAGFPVENARKMSPEPLAADTMTGIDGRTVHALPHGPLVDLMREFGRV
jgi:hypothetical protein